MNPVHYVEYVQNRIECSKSTVIFAVINVWTECFSRKDQHFAGPCWSASLATLKFRWSVFFKQYQQTCVWRWKLWSKIWPTHWRSHPACHPVDGGDYADVLDLLETFVRRELLICL